MNFNVTPSSSKELQAEGLCVYPSTPLQRPCYLSTASTPSTGSHHSSSPPSSPSLVSTTGSANTTSDADDDIFPLTPNSKSSFCVANDGAGPHNPGCSPESEHDNFVANSLSNGAGLQTLSCPPKSEHGRSVNFSTSEVISKKVKDAYMGTLQELSTTTSFKYIIHYLEAIRERHHMLYHAACWEVSEHTRWKALTRSMREDSKQDYLKAEQEVWFLLEILGRHLALSTHPVVNYSAEFHDNSRTSVCWTDAVLIILNGAKEMCPADNCSTQGADSLPKIFVPPYPFPNMSIYWLMSWMHSGGNPLSETKVSHLVKDVILADDFDRNNFENFSVRWDLQELDIDESSKRVTFPDDWVQTKATINIPTKAREDGPQPYTIHGFHYQPLVEVICVV
ncbi:hypothetical protein EDB19DRAFT_1904110 [Suillus lakei]|nr:hypothetical protein EDB19DRAFT_1904110 [Suillus lakei]